MKGKIVSAEDSSIIDYADIYLKGTSYWCTTDRNGAFSISAPAGTYTLAVAAIGFETYEEAVTIASGSEYVRTIALKADMNQLEEVVVMSERKSRVRNSAFNAEDLSVKQLHNSSKNLGEALSGLPGLKLRESGGPELFGQQLLD